MKVDIPVFVGRIAEETLSPMIQSLDDGIPPVMKVTVLVLSLPDPIWAGNQL